MLNKFVKEAITSIVGKQAAEIVDFLDNKKYVNEFLIAKKMNITVNQVRNILYKLSDKGLASSIRKKDKRKGWYTYFWKVEVLKSLEFLKSILTKRVEQINYHIKSRETKNFYVCERCNIEFNEETALLYNFTCNECGDVFVIKDNTKLLKEFKKTRDKLKKKLVLLNGEIKKEREVIEKKRLKELAKEERAKQKKKALKKKSVKKTIKLKTKKKSVTKKKLIKKKKIVKPKTKKKSVKKKKSIKKKKIVKPKTKKKSVKKKINKAKVSKRLKLKKKVTRKKK